MTRLINTYRACPTPSNRVKLQTYLSRHSMATVLAAPDEIAFLRANSFVI